MVSDLFLNTCHALKNGLLLLTNGLIVTCFKLCTLLGSLDSLDLMMKVFNAEFSEEFMALAVLIKQCPIKVTENKTKSPKSNVHDWPQLVSDTTKLQCAWSYWNATIWHPPAVCTICSRRFSEGKHESFQIADTCTKLPFALEEL